MLDYYEKYISKHGFKQDEYAEKMMAAQAYIYSCRSASDVKNLEGMTNRQIEIAAKAHKDEILNKGIIVSA